MRGPVERAIRKAISPGATLTTFGQSKPFVVKGYESDAMVILLGSGEHRTKIPWVGLEAVPDFLQGNGWIRAGGQFSVEGEQGTLDAYLKQWLKRDIARWVVRVLAVAGVVEVDDGRPLRLRLSPDLAGGLTMSTGRDSNVAEARTRLRKVLRELADENRDHLEDLKRAEIKHLERDDWLWHALLQAASSWGNSRGWEGLIKTPENYQRVTWSALEPLSQVEREQVIDETLRDAKVRMPSKKAGMLARNFTAIKELGGPVAAKEKLFAAEGKRGKIRFLRGFEGIGPKYARNTMMDLYHEEFRESIAVDARIKSVSIALGVEFPNYQEHEGFYCAVAREANLEAWEVDRVMYWFTEEVLRRLERPEGHTLQRLLRRIAELEERVAEIEGLEERVARLEA